MNVSPALLLITSLLVAGCVAQPATPPRASLLPATSAVAASPTKLIETRYDVRGYRDTTDRSLRHDAHAVYRRTRVPNAIDETASSPRTTFLPVSVTPLPASEELAAELAAQKKITAELFALQAALVDAEQKMRTQYAALVSQSAETLKLREQLEAERNRIRSSTAVSDAAPAVVTTAPLSSPEVKW